MIKNIIYKIKQDKRFLYRLYFYFREGYAIYISFPVGVLNFLVIQYTLLVERIPMLKSVFPNIGIFAVFAIPLLFTLAVVLGYFRYKKKLFTEEARVQVTHNPAWQELFKRLDKFEKDIEYIKQCLKNQS